MPQETISATLLLQNALQASRISKKMESRLSVHGISMTEYLVMQSLSQDAFSEVSRITLADHLGMSASGVTRLLLPMEKNKIIEKVKNPRDARQSRVRLSATGKRVFEEARVTFEQISSDLACNLTQTQQERLVELLEKIQ
ncbi:MarR family transcriptional regulator [Microbulbifer bruguierae]|uniref:MarR family transcriptional regulator n=1 Tax=Microbulbifer bruguierae TaxID=3029061 RepID=A0ABY8NG36_9GAMM|nr:MarR family transcriptional regulator [Microbulbifer bruguierae]WGL17894.1 MarR family transcriptional regulator [Microbulbifer bruguierae]